MKGPAIGALLVLFFVFVPLERLAALHRDQRIFRAGWFNDAVHFLVNNVLTQAGLIVTVGAFAVLLHWVVGGRFQAAVAIQSAWLQFAEALVIVELGGYAGHRLCHRVPTLWRFHQIHHSIREMDWLAAARLHPIDQIFTRTIAIVPLFVMGFTRETLGAYIALATLQAIFVHANVRLRFGPLRWLVNTPEFHHWHHAADAEARDKNFAPQCPLTDLLFGTLYMPNGRMPTSYGVDAELPATWPAQMVHPFRKNR